MGGNKEGARKRRETLIKMLGSEALYLEHMRTIAARGGENPGPGRGFASEKVDGKGLTGKERAKRSRWAKDINE